MKSPLGTMPASFTPVRVASASPRLVSQPQFDLRRATPEDDADKQAVVPYNPGGELVQKFVDEGIVPFERLFQTLPEEGMFLPGLNYQNPFQFTVGSYTVPKSMTLWLEDYHVGVLLPDPVNPGDHRFAEVGRFSGNLGFEILVADGRTANLAYQLDPVPVSAARQEFEQVVRPPNSTGPVPASTFNRSLSMSFASVAGSGTSLQPPRSGPPGPPSRSYVRSIAEDQVVAVKCVVFRRILTPIAGVYAILGGHIMHNNIASALKKRVRAQ